VNSVFLEHDIPPHLPAHLFASSKAKPNSHPDLLLPGEVEQTDNSIIGSSKRLSLIAIKTAVDLGMCPQ
jgi:hypothetical protein